MTHLFPLLISRGTVVFPGSSVLLEIGRDYSISAIAVALKYFNSQLIVVSQRQYDIDFPMYSDLYSFGTLSKVKVVKQNKDNSLVVSLKGLSRVQILNPQISFYKPDLKLDKTWYAEAIFLREKNTSFVKNKEKLERLIEYFEGLFGTAQPDIKKVRKLLENKNPSSSEIVDKLASFWFQNNGDETSLKQTWLEELDIEKRIDLMQSSEFVPEDVKNDINNTISRKVNKNISKQQKEFYLRERIKVIKEELGEYASREHEIQKIRARLKNENFPERVVNRVKEELSKLEYSPSLSNESMVIRTYIDWVMSLPWYQLSQDREDILEIEKILERNHYGLQKVKERIIEFIAVQKKIKKQKGSIICLVGPPGVGKTSLAKSIAEALNKEFVKISLGGLYDESEIRGHRKTYVAAMPGRIIKALKQAKVKNPLLLLDEIDKLSASHHGDPVHALLEVLDPKQNSQFSDNYIEEEFDLSQVMFVATANYEENIPDPLYNRLEVIHLSSYTEKEKLKIAESHLIKEVLEEQGLNENELSFTPEALLLIIRKYTRESGVRNLKQMLSKIARKFVRRQMIEKLDREVINESDVKRYLSYELYDFTIRDDASIPGMVNGMAYTESGGDLLPIEVNYFSGKGNLSLTGNLKETMRESASVALSYVRANEDLFQLKKINWSNIDINLHVPTGGIPKDGPSAGITITTALISLFKNFSVPQNIAMTGEITLRGKVLPIGGLKEKVISSVRGGVDTIFFPHENIRHLEDIPDEIKDKVKLIPVKYYSEVYDYIFQKSKTFLKLKANIGSENLSAPS